MKKFQFGLDGVMRYKQQVLEGAQNEYAVLVQRVQQQEQRLQTVVERYRAYNQEFRQAEAEGITIAQAMGYESGLRALEREQKQEEKRLKQMQAQAEQGRQRLVAARQDTNSLEKLKEKKSEVYRKEVQKQEEEFIDELVSNTRAVAVGSI